MKNTTYFQKLPTIFLWVIFTAFLLAACGDDEKPDVKPEVAPTLTFDKLTKPFAVDEKFTIAELSARIKGDKKGYSLKEIKDVSPSGIVKIEGKAPNYEITILKVGSFTATIVLKHSTKPDAIVKNCAFEITKQSAPDLTWTKQNKKFASGGEVTNAEILSSLTGAEKADYKIKTVVITSKKPSDMGGNVSGSGENAKITGYTKVGIFTLTVVFEHPYKADKSLSGDFEITSTLLPAPTDLIWKGANGLSEKFDGSFLETQIFNNIDGTKSGYTIKEISNLTAQNPANNATISSDKKSINYTKVGVFTATITLEHSGKAEVILPNSKFQITKSDAPTDLIWKNQNGVGLSEKFDGSFSEAQILDNVGGTNSGYSIKEITNLDNQNPANNATMF